MDAGALVALERGDHRMIALLQAMLSNPCALRVPAGVVAQVWRNGARQAVLSRFLKSDPVEILSLDPALARAVGELCAATGTADIVDASVVITAKLHEDTIVTSDPDDLRRLDEKARIEAL